MKTNPRRKTARKKAAHKSKIQKAKRRMAGLLKKKKNRHLA